MSDLMNERVVRHSPSRGSGSPDVWGIYEPDTGSIQYVVADPATKKAALHLCPFFGSKPLGQIETSDIERFKRARRSDGAAKATVNRELAVVSHLLNKAVEWKWMKARAARILRFKEENGRIVYLTDTQCAALLLAATQDHNENVHAFILVGLHTSMRHSEILAIRRDDIDLGRRVVWIPKAKAGAREQPITADLCQYLERRMQMLPPGCGWLFHRPAAQRATSTPSVRPFDGA